MISGKQFLLHKAIGFMEPDRIRAHPRDGILKVALWSDKVL